MHKSVNVSVKFHFTVERVDGLPPSQSVYSLAWSISKGIGRVWNGGSRKVLLTGSTATFNETFDVTGTMHQIKSGKFESKPMKISLQEEATKGKKIQAKAAAKLVLELADVALLTRESEARSYPFTGTKLKTAPVLHVKVRAEWLKYDGKLVTTGAQGAVKGDGTKREAVEVGGQQVYLMTDQEISDDDDASKEEDPFTKDDSDAPSPSSPAKAYEGNPLFRKMGGDYENPNKPVSSTQALIEQSKTPPPNALFKMADGTIKGPGEANSNSSARLLEEARAVTHEQQQQQQQKTSNAAAFSSNPFGAPPSGALGAADAATSAAALSKAQSAAAASAAASAKASSATSSSNPFGAPPVAAAVAREPSTPSQRSVSSPATAASPVSPVSPSNDELELLRKQNKSLKELLERQDDKIEQLRVKVRTGNGAGPVKKSSSVVDPLQRGGDSFVREKERALEELSMRLVDAEKLVTSTRVQLNAEKQQVASVQAALMAEKKRADELAASLAAERKRTQEVDKTANTRAAELEAELGKARKRVEELEAAVALEKKRNQDMFSKLTEVSSSAKGNSKSNGGGGDSVARVAELEAALALERSKKPAVVAPVVAPGTVDNALLEAERKRSAALAKELEQSQLQLSAVNRELSGKQLTMIELTNRLRDAEEKQQSADRVRRTANGAPAPHPLEGEINSLRMQIVAMEQDYEGQLEDLRSQLEELQGGGGGRKSADDGNSSTLERSSNALQDEAQPGSTKVARPLSQSGPKTVPLEEFEEMQERNRKRIEQLETKLAVAQRLQGDSAPSPLAISKNPLMSVVPAMSPAPAAQDEDGVRAELAVMRGVEEGVWSAPLEYDDEGVAVAARLIIGVVTDNPKARYSAKLHKGLANAIAKIASNQSSLDGKFYWLNSVMQLLHVLSSTPEYGVRSPMEVGIDLESRKLTSSQAGPLVPPASSALGDFPNRVHELSLSIYQMILDDVRDLVVNEALVRAIFDPALTSRASLGAKHNAGNARSPDSIAAELDSVLLSCVKAHLFPAVVRQLFAQLFYDMNAVLFNSLLKRTELCSASRAIEIKLGVSHFDNWPASALVPTALRDVLRGVSARGFAPLKESCNLFFLDKSDALMIRETCPSLNPRQIKSLLSAFTPDDIAPDKPALSVLDALGDQVRKTDTLKLDEKVMLTYARTL